MKGHMTPQRNALIPGLPLGWLRCSDTMMPAWAVKSFANVGGNV